MKENLDNDYIARQMDGAWRYGLATGFIIGFVPMLLVIIHICNH